MRVLLLTSLLAIPASAASPPSPSVPLFAAPAAPVPVISVPDTWPVINPNPRAALGLCPPTAAQMAADRVRKTKGRDLFHKLTQLPSGNMYVAVLHHDANGCEAPIVVKYDVGRR